MNHIYHLPEFGEQWFNYQKLYSLMVEKFPSGSKFVEIGSWKGKSAAFMAVEIINSKKNISFDCVDIWKIDNRYIKDDNPESNILYEIFINNTKSLSNVINPIRMDSIKASKTYEDNSIDFVYIDANHKYDYVKNDIEAWFPKVKKGGVIAGHDYDKNWPGVIKAVDEFFIDKSVLITTNYWTHYKN